MHRLLRLTLTLLAVSVLVMFPVGHALAAEPPATPAGTGPAVEAPPPAADEPEQPWTARFLAPTVMLLGGLALGGSVLYYAVRIRGRYTVKS